VSAAIGALIFLCGVLCGRMTRRKRGEPQPPVVVGQTWLIKGQPALIRSVYNGEFTGPVSSFHTSVGILSRRQIHRHGVLRVSE